MKAPALSSLMSVGIMEGSTSKSKFVLMCMGGFIERIPDIFCERKFNSRHYFCQKDLLNKRSLLNNVCRELRLLILRKNSY